MIFYSQKPPLLANENVLKNLDPIFCKKIVTH